MSKDKRHENNNLQGEIWNEEDDALLAETVLRNVREGKSIIAGCREVEELTDGRRTATASKYRWFTKLVDQYRAGYELAKQEGDKVKASKKRKVNKGQRYEEIIQEVFNADVPAQEREITADDFVILAQKFKSQEQNKEGSQKKLEKELNAERQKVKKLEKELADTKKDLKDTVEMLGYKNNDYNNLVEALQVLKKAGIQINIPEPTKPKFKVGKDGIVESI